MSPSVVDSIKARLLEKARSSKSDFQLLLDRYACERFLYRLGKSSIRNECILKGATLLGLWMEEPYRATRDIDLLAYSGSDEETVGELVHIICGVPCPEDGITFDLGSLKVASNRENQRYQGQRARLPAYLGQARCTVQVDFGFGDVVTPEPEEAVLPTLVDGLPQPSLRTYPRVSTIAEKFEAMVKLGTINSRMRDFYDVWALSEYFAFEGAELQEAIQRCFERRGTEWTARIPEALGSAFYSRAKQQSFWRNYMESGQLLSSPPSGFEDIGRRIQAFLGPVRESILNGQPFEMHWPAGGPWQSSAASIGRREE